MFRTRIARFVLTAGLIAASAAASAATPTHELMICVGKTARAITIKCALNGENLVQAPDTTLFAQYANGWRLIGTENDGGTLLSFTFFLERPKN
jgi:hypothetical protein